MSLHALPELTNEVAYALLIVGLVVIPRALQRFRIPAPLTSFALGVAAALWLSRFGEDSALALMATLGISSLFLFAGLEIDVADLRRGAWPLAGHLAVRSATLAVTAYLAMRYFGLPWQAGVLVALALLTPSTGFILDTLGRLGLDDNERYWVTINAVGGELLALAVVFVVLQSGSADRLAWSSMALVAMIFGLPVLFIGLGRLILPHAPGSEFSLLVMVGLTSAYLTYKLGVYYLVGAFLAGFVARLLRERMPALASDDNLHAVQLFASFFIPFYFFYNGMSVPPSALTWEALWLGLAGSALLLPLRIGIVWLQRRFIARETPIGSLRVATALTPTLIFTLVLATILRDKFQISGDLYGALLVYAAITTILPSLVLSRPVDFSPAFAAGTAPEDARAAGAPARPASAEDRTSPGDAPASANPRPPSA